MKKLFALILAALPFVVSAQSTIRPFQGGTGIQNNNASTLTWSGNFATTFTRTGITSVTFPTSGTLATTADIPALPLTPQNGGTGVANNSANTLTWSGNFPATFTLTGSTGVTFPTSGTLATTSQLISTPVSPGNGGTGVSNNSANTLTWSGNFAFTGTLTNTTSVTFPTSGTLCGSVTACTVTGITSGATTGTYTFGNTGNITSQADGIITLFNAANSDFTRLQFGGTSSSFPALKRNSAQLWTVVGNDSAFAISASLAEYTTNGFRAGSGGVYGITDNTTNPAQAGSVDTAISRVSAGVVGVGTGAAGSAAGSLFLTNAGSGAASALSLGTGTSFTKQVEVTHTASANRYITMTGSNGGNPTIGTSAGDLLIGTNLALGSGNSLHWNGDTGFYRANAGVVGVTTGGFTANGALQFAERSTPTGQSNSAVLYADDSGGKTRLMVIFGSGAAQQIAIEP